MLRGRDDRYHRLGFIIPFTVGRDRTPIQMAVGDSLARWVYNNQPVKFAAIELVPADLQRRARDAVRAPQRERHGQRRHPHSRPGLDPVRSAGPATARGARASTSSRPATSRPSPRSTPSTSAWDVMVGARHPAVPAVALVRASWIVPATHAHRAGGSCASAAARRRGLGAHHGSGWVVTEVGRQPWIVYNYMKVEDGGDRQHRGVAHVHRGGDPLRRARRHDILVLRGMSSALSGVTATWRRRVRRQRRAVRPERTALIDLDRNAGLGPDSGRSEPAPREHAHRRRAVLGVTAYAVFGGADFGAGFWDLLAGGDSAGPRPRGGDRPLDRAGLGSRPRLADLLLRRAVDRFSEAYASITLTLFVPLTLAAVGIVLRGASFAFRKAVFRDRDRRNFGAAFALSSVLVPFCMGRWPAASHPVGCRPGGRRAIRGTAG